MARVHPIIRAALLLVPGMLVCAMPGTAARGAGALPLRAGSGLPSAQLIYTAQETLWTLGPAGGRTALLPRRRHIVTLGDAAPALAPDHRHLLYSTTTRDLWLLDTAGGSPRQLLSLPARSFLGVFTWSTDSTGVVYLVRTDRASPGYRGIGVYSWALDTLDLATRRTRVVARSSRAFSFLPRPVGWSRRSHRVFLLEGQDGGAPFYRVLDDNGVTWARLSVPNATVQATLSPDGRNALIVAFPYTAGGQTALSVRPAAQPSRTLFTVVPPRGWSLSSFAAWSPDGRSLAYSVSNLQDQAVPTDRVPIEMRIADLATGRTRLVRRERGVNTHVLAWSPDGRTILIGREVMDASRAERLVVATLRPDGAGESALPIGDTGETQVDVVGWAAVPGPDRS